MERRLTFREVLNDILIFYKELQKRLKRKTKRTAFLAGTESKHRHTWVRMPARKREDGIFYKSVLIIIL